MEKTGPYIFDEFFSSGREESISPFLTPTSRRWGKNLSLKMALLSALFLALSFAFSFTNEPLSYLFLSLVYFLVGTPAVINTLLDLKNLDINIDVLMTLAALLSIVIGSGMEGGLLLVLFRLSAAMERTVTQRTKSALTHLNRLAPKTAFVIEDQVIVERSIQEVNVGDHLLIKAGEIVPLDGTVIAGSSFVNLVHLTGETQPASKQIGDEVQAGAQNLEGTLTVKVERTSHDSTLTRIIHLITGAQEAKPKVARLFDRFGKYYATTIIILSALFAALLPFFFHLDYLGEEGSIYRALAFLIAASPCALIIATPTAYLSAISACAKKGILLKGGVILDAIAKCSIVAFDKTGTITTGELTCTEVQTLTPDPIYDTKQAIAIAAALEQSAVHPIAHAITNFASAQKIQQYPITDFLSKPGFGIEAKTTLNNKEVPLFIGHAEYILEQNPSLEPYLKKESTLSTFLLIGTTLFSFHFTDSLRTGSEDVITRLKKYAMRLIMLTGDHKENAEKIAHKLGLDEYHSSLRPEDKLNKVIELNQTGELIMVGDGVNDAPALARSTVGISMGKIGSATAVEASDIVFLRDDFSLLDWLIAKGNKTLSIVKQNIILALIVILFATTPALMGYIPLWLAVVLHEGGTVIVGLNSLRLLRTKGS